MKKRDRSEVFPWTPLKEVAYELRFHPLLRIEQEISQFQEKVRSEFPGVTVGRDQEARQRIWSFESDGKTSLRLSVTSFALVTTNYTSFKAFLPLIQAYQTILLDTFRIGPIQRLGLRYVNAFPIGPLDSGYPNYHKFFVPDYNLEFYQTKDLITYRSEVRMRRDEDMLTVRTGMAEQAPDGRNMVYVLDLDAFRIGKFEPNRLDRVAQSLHETIKEEFYRHITDEFVEQMRTGSQVGEE